MKSAPNLELFFTDRPYEERIARIANMGFKAADLFSPDNKNPAGIGKACEQHGVTISMLVGSDLQKAYNDRALHADLIRQAEKTAQAAIEMHACNIVVLSGNALPKVPASAQNQAIIDGLKRLIQIAEKYQVTFVIEMLNSLYDHPGYYLDSTELMVNLVRAVNHPRIKGLYDIYHAGIMGGNIIEDIRAGIDAIGHFHIAGIPGRHEPKEGEQNYPVICKAIDKAGYKGYIGLEYWPLKPAEESLKETLLWLNSYNIAS
jgi:hydroxypyruvate isomerase